MISIQLARETFGIEEYILYTKFVYELQTKQYIVHNQTLGLICDKINYKGLALTLQYILQ